MGVVQGPEFAADTPANNLDKVGEGEARTMNCFGVLGQDYVVTLTIDL